VAEALDRHLDLELVLEVVLKFVVEVDFGVVANRHSFLVVVKYIRGLGFGVERNYNHSFLEVAFEATIDVHHRDCLSIDCLVWEVGEEVYCRTADYMLLAALGLELDVVRWTVAVDNL